MNHPPPLAGNQDHGGYLAKYAPKKEYTSIAEAVTDGTRFIVIPFVFSIIIVSFRRHLGGVYRVHDHEFPISKLFLATLITMLFGWWGIPFGIIWSVISMFQLWNGGKDVTLEILQDEVGKEEAVRIIKAARKPKKPASLWLVRGLILLPFILLGIAIASSSGPK